MSATAALLSRDSSDEDEDTPTPTAPSVRMPAVVPRAAYRNATEAQLARAEDRIRELEAELLMEHARNAARQTARLAPLVPRKASSDRLFWVCIALLILGVLGQLIALVFRVYLRVQGHG